MKKSSQVLFQKNQLSNRPVRPVRAAGWWPDQAAD